MIIYLGGNCKLYYIKCALQLKEKRAKRGRKKSSSRSFAQRHRVSSGKMKLRNWEEKKEPSNLTWSLIYKFVVVCFITIKLSTRNQQQQQKYGKTKARNKQTQLERREED